MDNKEGNIFRNDYIKSKHSAYARVFKFSNIETQAIRFIFLTLILITMFISFYKFPEFERVQVFVGDYQNKTAVKSPISGYLSIKKLKEQEIQPVVLRVIEQSEFYAIRNGNSKILKLEKISKQLSKQLTDKKNELSREKLQLKNDLMSTKLLIEKLKQSREIKITQNELATTNFNIIESMFLKGLSSKAQLDSALLTKLGSKSEVIDVESSLTLANIKHKKLREMISNMPIKISSLEAKFSLLQTQNDIALLNEKKSSYVDVIVPTNTQITDMLVTDGEFVSAGQPLFILKPNNTESLFKIHLQDSHLPNLSANSEVYIFLDAFSQAENVPFKAVITNIPETPLPGTNLIYEAQAKILNKNLEKRVQLVTGMKGYAVIVTERRTILNRILNPIKGIHKVI